MNRYVVAKLLSVLIAAFSQVALKASANKEHKNTLSEYFNPYVILSYGVFVLSTIMDMYSLKGNTLSFNSIIESFSYILIPTFSYLFLKEKITKRQLIGSLIIFAGFFIYSL